MGLNLCRRTTSKATDVTPKPKARMTVTVTIPALGSANYGEKRLSIKNIYIRSCLRTGLLFKMYVYSDFILTLILLGFLADLIV